MARFIPAARLDVEAAGRIAAPEVTRLAQQVEAAARRRAPDAKAWLTARDERVRPVHADADGQTIPDNLRYILLDPTGDQPSGRRKRITPPAAPGTHLAREPRADSLPAHLRINCRCQSVPIPQAVARTILAEPTQVLGTRARAVVACSFPRATESEFGTAEDKAAAFMRGAINEVAARSSNATARRT